MNILIKLTCLVGLVIAPILGGHTSSEEVTEEVTVSGEYQESIDDQGNFQYNLGETIQLKLPSGNTMEAGERSIENKLFTRLSSDAPAMGIREKTGNDWLTMDRVHFQSNSSELLPISTRQLRNIATIMNEYPNAKIKIGGYTDNTGADEVNDKVSTDRANIVKAELVKLGVDESRMQAEGYGAQHFVCAKNDTDICKAKNRRVDVKIVSK